MGIVYKPGDPLERIFAPTVLRLNILNTLSDFIKEHCPSGRDFKILDIGCGSGVYALYFMSKGVKGFYLGVDNASKFKDKQWDNFSSLSADLKINFKPLDATELLSDCPMNDFDIVICLVALEHIKDYAKVLKQIPEIMSPGGMALIIVPSRYTWLFTMGKHGYHYFSRDAIINEMRAGHTEVLGCFGLGGMPGYLFDLAFSWFMSVLCKFTDVDDFILKMSGIIGRPYGRILNMINKADNKLPFLETGYAYIIRRS